MISSVTTPSASLLQRLRSDSCVGSTFHIELSPVRERSFRGMRFRLVLWFPRVDRILLLLPAGFLVRFFTCSNFYDGGFSGLTLARQLRSKLHQLLSGTLRFLLRCRLLRGIHRVQLNIWINLAGTNMHSDSPFGESNC